MADVHDIARRWLALWNGDRDLLDDLVAETVVTHAVMVGQVTEQPMIGREALGAWIVHMHRTMPTLRFVIEVGPLVDGHLIALRWRAAGTHGAARITVTGTDLLRVVHDRIAAYWVNSDTSSMVAQMQAAATLT